MPRVRPQLQRVLQVGQRFKLAMLMFNFRFQKAIKLKERFGCVPAIQDQSEGSWKLEEPRHNRLPQGLDDSDLVRFAVLIDE